MGSKERAEEKAKVRPACVSRPSVVHGGGSCASKDPSKQPIPTSLSRGGPFRQDTRTVDVHPPRWGSAPRPIEPSITPQENSPLEWGKLLGWDQAWQRRIAQTTVSSVILCHHLEQGRG